MDSDLLNSLIADCAVAAAFCALMMSLAAVSRHPALRGAILYAFGHLGFTAGASLFILMLDAGVPASQRPLIAWAALLISTTGCAAMVDGMSRLLEHPHRAWVTRIAWAVVVVLLLLALMPWRSIDPLKLASDLTNALGMIGLAAVLLRPLAAPYRIPALAAGACTAVLAPMYFIGSVQQWTGVGPVIVPPYATWVWLDLALWNTMNLCVMMLASFRALVVFVRRSRTDALTHCLNRSGLEDELNVLTVRLAPETPVVVLALDIDHFKAINDRCGHAAGDAYLKRFAQVLQSCVRQSDLVARIGGEEFVALLVDAHPDAGERVAAKVLEAIRELDVDCEGESVRTTVSIGISTGFGLTSIEALMRRADRALYAAKGSGRDRICTAGLGETTGAGVARAI
jgi:diguanylate cyclase (GGDEF)-like protein